MEREHLGKLKYEFFNIFSYEYFGLAKSEGLYKQPATMVGSIMPLTRRDREVVDFTRSRVKNNTELTNLGN